MLSESLVDRINHALQCPLETRVAILLCDILKEQESSDEPDPDPSIAMDRQLAQSYRELQEHAHQGEFEVVHLTVQGSSGTTTPCVAIQSQRTQIRPFKEICRFGTQISEREKDITTAQLFALSLSTSIPERLTFRVNQVRYLRDTIKALKEQVETLKAKLLQHAESESATLTPECSESESTPELQKTLVAAIKAAKAFMVSTRVALSKIDDSRYPDVALAVMVVDALSTIGRIVDQVQVEGV